jgi:hypothetical protein
MKTIAMFVGALIVGFLGGIAGNRFSQQTMSTEVTPSTRARTFELLDSSGRVVSVWTTDRWGRPLLGFSDAKWEGRIVIGPIDQSDVATNEPPDPNSAWGISVTAPGHVAHAVLGTGTDLTTKKPIAFAHASPD